MHKIREIKSNILFIFALLLLSGCVANQHHYAQPLYEMEVLEMPQKSESQIDQPSDQTLASLNPGQRPSIDSDEAGIWMAMDKAEESYKTSGKLIRNPELNKYLNGLIRKLTPEHCANIRVYAMRVPYFNAFMAPNGVMVVWSGLLVRAQNEAQVASVLGHEIGHYLRRHSLQQMRNTINTTSALAFFRLATAAMGVGIVGDTASLAGVAGMQSYGRDMEREADGYGLAMLARANYSPREAAKLWKQVITEKEASDDDNFSMLIFDSHPPSEERLDSLDNLADQIVAKVGELETGEERYLNILAPFRFEFLKDELHQREFPRLEVLLKAIESQKHNLGEIYYYWGEFYRLRRNDGDIDKAIQAYQKASREVAYPAETFRALGLIYKQKGEVEKARECFTKYINKKPDAEDVEMIRHIISRS